ncbi:MAG: DNA methyltransferase, partial [Elusimicrobiota bacterium]
MKNPKHYNLTPAKGQALLNYQGRLYPDKVELFETKLIEEVRQKKKSDPFKQSKETDLNPDFRNLLIHGDCLSACAYLKSQDIKVDLVYIDPPFASGANYAKQIHLRNGKKNGIESDDNSIGEEIMYSDIWQKEDYLNWLYERLLAIKEVTSETGSIYVHLDWHIGHYVKLLLDEVFGEENFRNEIIWRYRRWPSPSSDFQKMHDALYRYSLTTKPTWNQLFEPKSESTLKAFGDIKLTTEITDRGTVKKIKTDEKSEGTYMSDVWEISHVQGSASEERANANNYATQKPEALLERIIKASSNEGMIIADFFIGSGTTAKMANDMGRKFIACDIGINAVQTTRDRLIGAGANFDVLKVNDGVRLFRNPAQTTARIFSLIDGFKNRTDLELGEFWDGGIINNKGSFTPVKFIGIHEKLTKHLADIILEEIYQLESDSENAVGVKLIYAHKELDIDQDYINKEIRKSGKTTL